MTGSVCARGGGGGVVGQWGEGGSGGCNGGQADTGGGKSRGVMGKKATCLECLTELPTWCQRRSRVICIPWERQGKKGTSVARRLITVRSRRNLVAMSERERERGEREERDRQRET